ncbi:ABC-2 type transporter, NodJ family [Pseudogulbenkiania sp. NH8B]|uniref:ABC transporter permease n=1 Tax=Pseudogulbenkiania sp. (strain NH8B) TaxID=748280 RepID=UPI0002279F22|nr:ABC transporter permease [Pseudogulbenkiania sp. NH8B]BAK77809.1 ABC-2 type transporter, NodJ family [Pseudogulbenkiania sp. NH8B]
MLPRLSLRFIPVWLRNFLVWKKLAAPSILGNLADPMLYMLGLGFGIGSLLPSIGGVPYIQFLAAGTVCYSTMNSATFEALYSAFSRMHVQKTWSAIINAPLTVDDVVLGEWLWAASKSLLSGLAILLVMGLLGLIKSPLVLWIVPLIALSGLAFAGMGLVVTALSPSYDFFMYYFTLVVSPMMLISGVFYPAENLPGWIRAVAEVLPLTHAIRLARPLVNATVPPLIWPSLLILLLYAVVSFSLAVILTRRRLLK